VSLFKETGVCVPFQASAVKPCSLQCQSSSRPFYQIGWCITAYIKGIMFLNTKDFVLWFMFYLITE